jgi:hypothetical protein
VSINRVQLGGVVLQETEKLEVKVFKMSRIQTHAKVVVAVLLSFLLCGCGPTPLNDQEFTKSASATCSALNKAIVVLPKVASGWDYYELQASDYKTAADALDKLTITNESAPNGTALRSGIRDLAKENQALSSALQSALSEAGLGGGATLVIADDGHFSAYGTSVFHITVLNVDPSLLTKIRQTQQQVAQVAQQLGLSDCAIESWLPPTS